MIRIKWLQALRAVVRSQSVTGAAAILHVTQPAVSRMIANLEIELGFPLFIRQKGRLTITPQGQTFYAEVERILEDFDGISRIGASIRQGAGAMIRIASTSSLVRDVFPPVIKKFREEYPSIQVSLSVRGSPDVLSMAGNRQFDFGIVSGPMGQELAAPFASSPALAVMFPDHRLAAQRRVTLSDLGDENLILVPALGIVRKWLDGKFAEIGKISQARIEVTSTVATCQMAASGLGIAIADPFAAHSIRDQPYAARRMQSDMQYSFSFITNNNRALPRHSLRMMEIIQSVVAEQLEGVTAAALKGK